MKISVSIIIPVYNSEKIIGKCLTSLISQTQNLGYEIIIVDNNSQDGTRAVVKEFEGGVEKLRLIESSENMGYGRALNLGSKNANGEFLLFINPDIILKNNAISLMIKKSNGGEYILAAPVLVSESGKRQISVWANFPSPANLLSEYSMFNGVLKKLGVKKFPFFIYDYDPQPETSPKALSGAAWLIRKEDFQELGGFDENFFLYYEDTDFCRRLYEQNSQAMILVTGAEAIHLEGKSSGDSSEIVASNSFRSMFYYLRKYYPRWQIFIFKIGIWFVSLLNFAILSVGRVLMRLSLNLEKRRREYKYFLVNFKKFKS